MDDAKRGKEQFEYLFLDIEWNQAPGTIDLDGREAIQIGVVAADVELQKVKTFSKAIRLSDPNLFNEQTERISHNSIDNIMQGNEENVVLSNFSQTFPDYHYLVVWTQDTYDSFIRDMRKYGISIKRHKVVILQEVLDIITGNSGNQIGFENALICAGIEYVPNYLHYAKHDANYLYQLFHQCFQQYSDMTVDESCLLNKATGKLHTENCRYMKTILSERKMVVSKNMIFKGYIVCKYCGEEQIWKNLEWEFRSKCKTQGNKYKDKLKQL